MDQAARDRVQHEIEEEVNALFPGSVRRVEWLRYGDEPIIEPGELLPRFVLADRRGRRTPKPREALKAFQKAHGPALKQFRHELAQRWPQIRHIAVMFEDDSGHHRGGIMRALDRAGPADRDYVPVTAWLEAAERETADTLILAGLATPRAEAITWALARIRERPAYARLRDGTVNAETIETEF